MYYALDIGLDLYLYELFRSFLNKLWKLDTLIIMIITQIGVEHRVD